MKQQTTMEVFKFDYDRSEKVFDQPCFKKLHSFQKLISSQLLFVTKNENMKLMSTDLNSFSYYKIVQGLQKFGTSMESKTLDLKPISCSKPFFVQVNDKIGARFDDSIMNVHFGKQKEEKKVLNETCKKKIFDGSKLEIFIVVRQLESKILCFVFGRNGEDTTQTLTKKQVHHFLLCLHAFTELK